MRFILYLIFIIFSYPVSAQVFTVYVSPTGRDNNAGTKLKPLKTIEQALSLGRSGLHKKVSIQLLEGTYYLDQTIEINSGSESFEELEIEAYQNETAVVSAGKLLKPVWEYFRNGIYRTSVPKDFSFGRLYINGTLQTMARYPNRDTTQNVFEGTAEDATYYMRVLSWGNPFGGYVHALDEHKKGSLHYKITGVDDTDNLELDGGWQHRNPVHMHNSYRYVENILSELDVPGEWYLDDSFNTLYYYPHTGIEISKAMVEVSNLKSSIEIAGTDVKPMKNITLKNLNFHHNERTFMDRKEYLPGNDWAVFPRGSVVLTNTENCKIENCTFTDLGGNAVVFNQFNQGAAVTGCLFSGIGASAISCFGKSLTSDLISDLKFNSVRDNLFQYIGEIEKQGAAIHLNSIPGFSIQINTIYHTPGAAIKMENSISENIKIDLNEIFQEYREVQTQANMKGKFSDNTSSYGSGSGVQKPELKKMTKGFR